MDGTLQALALVIFGAVVALDHVSVAQIQIAHPLVAGTIGGAIAGGVAGAGEGALVGGLLGLILAGHRPVGGVIPPDGGLGALVAAASLVRGLPLALAASGTAPPGAGGTALALALLIGLGLAVIGRGTEGWTRRLNLELLRRAEAEPTPGAVDRAILNALALAALRGAVTVTLAMPAALALVTRVGTGGGVARAAVVAIAGGVGLDAQERLLGLNRRRGLLLAAIGALLAVVFSLPELTGWGAGR